MTQKPTDPVDPTQWLPLKKKPGQMPVGYEEDQLNPNRILPIPEQIKVIDEALALLDKNASLREASEYILINAKLEVSQMSLKNIWDRKHGHLNTDRKRRLAALKGGTVSEYNKKQENKKKGARLGGKITQVKLAQKKKEVEAQKKIARINKNDTVTYDFEKIPKKQEIIFQPNPGPQTDFLAASEREVLYGGAAGGGKSAALLADPMRYFGNKNFVGLLIRRTNDELRELKRESQKIYPRAFPGAKWREKDSLWVFPSGAQLWLSYLDRDDDVLRYQGQAFTWIAVDELTQYPTPYAWDYLRSRLRTTDEGLKPYLSMRATTNPGGPGHHWVKKMFVDPVEPNKPFTATDIDTGLPLLHPRTGKPLFQRRFIPAKLIDNPYLYADGNYEASLLSLPEDQRRKLLDGDWTVTEGAAFPEFRMSVHSCDPYVIPSSWRRFRSCDYGYSSFSSVLWFAVDPSTDQLVLYRELYATKKTGSDLARMIIEIEREDRVSYGVLDSSVWHKRGHTGPSIAEEMIAMGCKWRPSDRSGGSRSAGKNRLHELLKVDEFLEQPKLVIFNTCRQILSDLPTLQRDPKGEDDIDVKTVNDHTYDALRYGIMSRPSAVVRSNEGRPAYQTADSRFGY